MSKPHLMKTVFKINLLLCLVVFTGLNGNANPVPGQKTKDKAGPIPQNIHGIFKASCIQCHSNKGGRFPRARLNFSRWESYGATKGADKALSICEAVKDGSMPPKKAREANPNIIPTPEQVGLICQWADSLNQVKTRK